MSNPDAEEFQSVFPLQMEDNVIVGALARNLYIALKRVARDGGLTCEVRSPVQMGVRLQTDRVAIKAAGFKVEVTKGRANQQRYTITYCEPGA